MAIRPPRAARRSPRTRLVRDLVIIAIVSTAVLLFALRCLMALLSLQTWTAAWRIVGIPTSLLIAPLERIDAFAQTLVGNLSVATILVSTACFVIALVVLGSLANQPE